MQAQVAGKKTSSSRMIHLKRFYFDVSRHPLGRKVKIIPPMVAEAFGGILNLYLEKAVKRGGRITVNTEYAFASKLVPLQSILTEIQNCCGANEKEAVLIFSAMQDVFRRLAVSHGIELKRAVFLGREALKFRLADHLSLARNSYILAFEDPASKHRRRFLF